MNLLQARKDHVGLYRAQKGFIVAMWGDVMFRATIRRSRTK